jgi:dienelactone hydrolase
MGNWRTFFPRQRAQRVALWLIMCVCLSGAVAGEDVTLEKGYVSKNSASKGIVVYLHGCDGSFNTSPATDWHDWLERSGFKIFAPNSFAEDRPPLSCSAPYHDKAEIYAIRLRQTVRVLEQIMQDYPDVPIYVWGHSEGGGVANLLSQKVDGILTTGYPCGFKRTPTTQIRPDVRVLVIMGSERLDHYLLEAHLGSGYATLQDLCSETFREHKNASWKQFHSLGHAPYPGNLELFAAVNEFFAIKTPW